MQDVKTNELQGRGDAKRVVSGLLAGAAGLLALPGVAFAQSQAYTNSPANLYAGPADDYPPVSQLPPGAPVTVMGCVSGYTWCDVATPDLRGWVYAGDLSYPYQGSNVPILSYGTAIGLPIVTFSIGTYWGSYYRGRPWYNDQQRWAHHPPPPPGRGGPPPGHEGPPPGHGGPPPGHEGPPPGHVVLLRERADHRRRRRMSRSRRFMRLRGRTWCTARAARGSAAAAWSSAASPRSCSTGARRRS